MHQGVIMSEISNLFPVWYHLTEEQKQLLNDKVYIKDVKKAPFFIEAMKTVTDYT